MRKVQSVAREGIRVARRGWKVARKPLCLVGGAFEVERRVIWIVNGDWKGGACDF